MKNDKIKVWQLALLLLTITPITKFILLPAALAKTLERDSYLLVAMFVVVDILAVIVIMMCHKKYPDLSFYQILENSVGKVAAKIIIVFYLFFFFIKTLAPIIEQKRMLAGNLYETIPRVSTLIPMFILAAYIAYKGAYALGRNANILGFVSIFSILVILLLSLGNVKFDNLLPIYDRSPKDLLTGVQSSIMWFGDFVIILFFLGKIQHKDKASPKTKSVIVSYVVSQVLIMAFYIILIAIYGEITERQVNAITKISKFNTALTNMGRFDWIPIILLMLCLMMSTCTTFYCNLDCCSYLIKKPKKIYLTVALTLIFTVVALILQDDLRLIYEFYFKYYNYVAFVLQYLIPFSLPLLILIGKKKHEKIKIIPCKKSA